MKRWCWTIGGKKSPTRGETDVFSGTVGGRIPRLEVMDSDERLPGTEPVAVCSDQRNSSHPVEMQQSQLVDSHPDFETIPVIRQP